MNLESIGSKPRVRLLSSTHSRIKGKQREKKKKKKKKKNRKRAQNNSMSSGDGRTSNVKTNTLLYIVLQEKESARTRTNNNQHLPQRLDRGRAQSWQPKRWRRSRRANRDCCAWCRGMSRLRPPSPAWGRRRPLPAAATQSATQRCLTQTLGTDARSAPFLCCTHTNSTPEPAQLDRRVKSGARNGKNNNNGHRAPHGSASSNNTSRASSREKTPSSQNSKKKRVAPQAQRTAKIQTKPRSTHRTYPK